MALSPDTRVGYDPLTRWLHFGLMVTVSYQLFISLVMERPKPQEPLSGGAALIFESHEWVGAAAFAIIVAHIVWSFAGPRAVRWTSMLPFHPAHRAAIWEDVKQLAGFRLPWREEHQGIAALVHGLGLLTVLGSGLTGIVLFFGLPENGALTPTLKQDLELHSFIANFTWAYWIGHVALAALHQITGHPVFQKIRPQ